MYTSSKGISKLINPYSAGTNFGVVIWRLRRQIIMIMTAKSIPALTE